MLAMQDASASGLPVDACAGEVRKAVDKPEYLPAARRRVSKAKSALAWGGFRVVLELVPA
jgi:hypothetical protein